MEPDGQPDEEKISEAPQDLNIANAVKPLVTIQRGHLGEREHSMETMHNCVEVPIMCLQIAVLMINCVNRSHWHFDLVKKAIEAHPDTLTFPGSSSGSSTTSWRERASGPTTTWTWKVSLHPAEGQRQKHDQGKGNCIIQKECSLYGMTMEGTYPALCIAEEGITTTCAVRTSRRWALAATTQSLNVSRQAHRHGIFLFHNEVIAAYSEETLSVVRQGMKTQDIRAVRMVSTVAFLKSSRREEYNFVILHGTTSLSQSHRVNTAGWRKKQPKPHSDSFRRTSGTTLDARTGRSSWIVRVAHRLRPFDVMKVDG